MPIIFTDGTPEDNQENIWKSDITITRADLEETPSRLKYVRLDILTRALLVRARQILTRKLELGDGTARPLQLTSWRFNPSRKGRSIRSHCWVRIATLAGREDLAMGTPLELRGHCSYCQLLNEHLAELALGSTLPSQELIAEGSKMYKQCEGLRLLVTNVLEVNSRLVAQGNTKGKLYRTLCHPWSAVSGALTQLKLDA